MRPARERPQSMPQCAFLVGTGHYGLESNGEPLEYLSIWVRQARPHAELETLVQEGHWVFGGDNCRGRAITDADRWYVSAALRVPGKQVRDARRSQTLGNRRHPRVRAACTGANGPCVVDGRGYDDGRRRLCGRVEGREANRCA